MQSVLYVRDEDLPYEEDLINNPHSLKPWFRYFDHKREYPFEERFYLYERALLEFTTSYKLWKLYLDERKDFIYQNQLLFDPQVNFANNCYERSLIYLHKMPRIWLDYAEFLGKQGKLRLVRKTFDRALHSLPIIQHDRIWQKYIEFAQLSFVPAAIGVRIWQRYVQYDPKRKQDFLNYLLTKNQFNDAALIIVELLDTIDEDQNVPKDQLLRELCKIVCENPDKIVAIPVEVVLDSFLKKFPESSGMIWCSLGNYHILKGNLIDARFAFEQGMNLVRSIKDFTLIYDAYYQLEKALLEGYFAAEDAGSSVDQTEMELLSLRMQRLLDDRERLVNDTFLRKNPNNISYWQKRIRLFSEPFENIDVSALKPEHKDEITTHSSGNKLQTANFILDIYETALSKINPKKTIGNYSALWIEYAHFTYRQSNDVVKARDIFERGLQVDFKNDEELAQLWIAYVKQEIEHEKSFDRAIELFHRATTPIARQVKNESSGESHRHTHCQLTLHKNMTLWSFFLDILEQNGDDTLVCKAYDRVIDLKICSVQTIVNYAYYLERAGKVEESFRVYERGIELFGYPVAYELWNIFLPRFVQHYGAEKLERIRDLFEQALTGCPPKFIRHLYVYYGMVEEQFGLTRNAMRIYDKATKAVPTGEKYEMFLFYIGRAANLYGITATREVFELAIAALPDKQVRELCLTYSLMEEKLGEVERARCIYVHGSQFSNPATEHSYWQRWNKFELEHGNQQTFKEMLRIKRAIETKYSSMVVIQKPSLVDAPEFTAAKTH